MPNVIQNFFRSVSTETANQLSVSGPAALVQTTPNVIMNDGLFGRKRTRMYFTQLKAVETRHSDTTLESESEAYRLPDVELYIDPQNISVRKKVIQRKQLTKGGWVIQFWGHDLTTVSVRGVSGYYGMTKGLAPSNIAGVVKSLTSGENHKVGALKVFEYLKENVYMRRFDKRIPFKGLPVIGLVYDKVLYRGYFEQFNYSLSATAPFMITYNFNFTIIPPESDLQELQDAKNLIPSSGQEVADITRGVAAGAYLNPDGTSQRVSDAMSNYITKATQAGIDELSKKLGVLSFIDVTPSRVVLY